MKFNFIPAFLYNEEGNDGGTGAEETNFSQWADGDMTNENNDENGDGTEGSAEGASSDDGAGDGDGDGAQEELGAGEGDASGADDKGDGEGSDGSDDKGEGESEESDPKELYEQIAAKEENKDKSEEELQALLEEELNKDVAVGALGGDEEEGGEEDTPTAINWAEEAKELGLVEGDDAPTELTKESFKELVDTKIEEGVTAVKEEYQVYDQLNETAKNFVHHLNEKGIEAMQNFLNPVAQYDNYLAMGKEDLVEANIRAEKDENGDAYYTDEEVADKMADLEDNPKELKSEYDKVRQGLIGARNRALETMSSQIQADRSAREAEANAPVYDVEKTTNVISSMDNFVGVPVAEKGRDSINKMVESGEVERLMKDPNFLAKSLMFHKFGEAAIKNIRTAEFQKGKNKSLAKQYNVPSINGGSASGGNVSHDNKTGTFEDWGKD